MFKKYNDGWIEAITGPMFSGKSEELIKRANSLIYAKQKFLVFKHEIDNRWETSKVKSRAGFSIECKTITNSNEIFDYITDDIKCIIVDEVQFFEENIHQNLRKIAEKGIRVIVAGLDMDYKCEPFGPMKNILAVAEFVTKLTAVCFECGKAAAFTYRKDKSNQEVVAVGDSEYEARCRKCMQY